MTREDPMMRIRLPEDLKAKVKACAEGNRRSMNAEILARLEWSLQEESHEKRAPPLTSNQPTEPVGNRIEALIESLINLKADIAAMEDAKN